MHGLFAPNILEIKPDYKAGNACILKKCVIFYLLSIVALHCTEPVLVSGHYPERGTTPLNSKFRVRSGLPEKSF